MPIFIARCLALLLSVSLLLVACGDDRTTSGNGSEAGSESPLVVAAFYPLQFLAERVAGEHADIAGLTPAGVEPHDLELTARQIRTLLEADLLLYVGQGFQPAVEDLIDQVDGEKLDVLAGSDLIPGTDDHDDDHGDEDGHEEGEFDPHVWLDPTRMAQITRGVEQRLSAVDPDNSADFKENADGLIAELEALDQEFTAGLAQCDRREIVTSHSAFGYLVARYDLEQHGISGLDPESEPSPQRLAEVASLVREEGVTTIFFETLLPPDLAETIARETGTKTAVLDPLESEPEAGDYLSEMRANLGALRAALDCS
ncbi:MAG TPA: metal ABC transporter substrate-binding protein [Actinomycetota bacterium]|nr:metal ABC transporter substrate-binding protein [Actinomycetota bacterium]